MVTTRALVTYDVDPNAAVVKPSFIMEELEIIDMADDELLVQMVATGLCHSDVTIASRPSPDGIPKILGHEGISLTTRYGTMRNQLKHIRRWEGYTGWSQSDQGQNWRSRTFILSFLRFLSILRRETSGNMLTVPLVHESERSEISQQEDWGESERIVLRPILFFGGCSC
jgi:hypothetical protein